MIISLIAAMDENRLIGADNALPWHLSADLKHFKAITLGKPVIMGRRTWDSIGKPLPGRTNIVITRDQSWSADGCIVVHDTQAALAATGPVEEVMIIGGASLYAQMMKESDRLYVTLVHAQYQGDTWFPEISTGDWIEMQREHHEPDEPGGPSYAFVIYERAQEPGVPDQS